MPCPAKFAQGKNKGQICGKQSKHGPYCGLHKSQWQGADTSTDKKIEAGSRSSLIGTMPNPRTKVIQADRDQPWSHPGTTKEDIIKILERKGWEPSKEEGGSLKNADKLVVQRRLVAWMWEDAKEAWATDLRLIAYASPFAAFQKTELKKIASDLGIQLQAHKDTNPETLLAVVGAVENLLKSVDSGKMPVAVLEHDGEILRRELFEMIFFGDKGQTGLVTLLEPPMVVEEAKQALEWACQDCVAVTSDSHDVLRSRQAWLEGLKKKFVSKGTVASHPLKGAYDKVLFAIKRVLIELAILNNSSDGSMHDKLAGHHTGAAFRVYPTADSNAIQPNKALVAAGSKTYFQQRGLNDFLSAMRRSLRRPQLEALQQAHEFHKALDPIPLQAGETLDREKAAIVALRQAFKRSVRKSYFKALSKKECLAARHEIGRLLKGVKDKAARPLDAGIACNRSSMIVLPTGLGKSVVICLLPFVLPLERSGRVLVIAPNLTIAGKESSGELNDAVAEGLIKDFMDPRWNCYHTHGLLPKGSPLPVVKGLKGLSKGATAQDLVDADVIVTNYHQFQTGRLESRSFPRDFFDAIIVDEAHHSESQSYQMIFEHFAAAHKVLLTATPHRSDRKEIKAPVIYRTSMKVCIQCEYIKDIVYCPVPVEAYCLAEKGANKPHSSVSGWDNVKNAGVQKTTQMAAFRSPEVRSSIMQHAMDCLRWLRNRTQHKHQAIVQALDIADAIQICQEWRDHPSNQGKEKLSIDFVASKDEALTDKEKAWHTSSTDKVKQMLRDGNLDVIVHVGMLGEGFDHRRLSVAVIFKPFRNIASYSQFVGRAIRRDTSRPKDKPCGLEEQVAFVIAHPASGMGEAWPIYCSEEQDPPGALDAKGSASDTVLYLTDQKLLPSPFKDGTALAVINGSKQSRRVQRFPCNLSPEEESLVQKVMRTPARDNNKSGGKKIASGISTPDGPLSAGRVLGSSSSSQYSASSSGRSTPSGRSSNNIVPIERKSRRSHSTGQGRGLVSPRKLEESYSPSK